MLSHLAVAATAAVITAAGAPFVVRLSRRYGVLEAPPDTGGPTRQPDTGGPTRPSVPSLGGLAMLLGFLAAMGVAWLLDDFAPLFASSSEPLALVLGALVIVAIGVVDDVVGLAPPIKLAGQIVAALAVVLLGVELVFFWVPGFEMIALSSDLAMPLTIIALVAMINALNLIDGLDGLAAGVAAIAAAAFFAFTVQTESAGLVEAVPISASLVAAIVFGMAIGFLVHNWHPARLFMGDTGSMLLGLLLGAAGVSYVGRTVTPSTADFYGALPLLIPALVLAVPFLDTAFAVIRRLARGRPVTSGDRGHLHHLLLAFGHSHRRAVIVLYYWSAVLAFGSVGPAYLSVAQLLPWLAVAAALGVAITALGVRAPRRRPDRTDPLRDGAIEDPLGAVLPGPGSGDPVVDGSLPRPPPDAQVESGGR